LADSRAAHADLGQKFEPAPPVRNKLEQLFRHPEIANRKNNNQQIFDERIYGKMYLMSVDAQICAIEELLAVGELGKVRQIGGYFMGILNRYTSGDRDHVIDPKTGKRTGHPPGPPKPRDQWANARDVSGGGGYGQNKRMPDRR